MLVVKTVVFELFLKGTRYNPIKRISKRKYVSNMCIILSALGSSKKKY